ncbi:MAG: hypothetical protein D6707_07905, partial [Bacteroidetes bacterium]
NLDNYRELFKKDFLSFHESAIQKFSAHPDAPLFETEKNRFFLTPAGFVLFDEICGLISGID